MSLLRTHTPIVLGILLLILAPSVVRARPLKVGDRLPPFALRTLDGHTVDSARAKHRALWLTFFQST